MSISPKLADRSGGLCELCGATDELYEFVVYPKAGDSLDDWVACCELCNSQLSGSEELDANHWRCLSESMWSEQNAVKVIAYRMLSKLSDEDWALDLREMMYLDDDTLSWAEQIPHATEVVVHRDSNGHQLQAGDTVVLIKDLNVKGANFTAKRGTAVRRISLVADNENHIEGRINDQRIVILTQYVKKSN